MLVAENLTKLYGDNLIINDISLKISKGQFVGIVGESGAGKSTLLYLLSCLISPTKGRVLLENENISSVSDKILSKIRRDNFGFVFQFNNLVSNLTVLENMEIPLILTSQDTSEHREKIKSLLEQVGLSDYAKRNVNELSGGQQQRVAIARALVNDPKIIFADEPTGSLDSENTDNIINLLGKLNDEHKVTIIMVTHSERTLSYCNRIINVSDGRIVNDYQTS